MLNSWNAIFFPPFTNPIFTRIACAFFESYSTGWLRWSSMYLGWVDWLWFGCSTILPSHFCQIPISPGRIGQTVKHQNPSEPNPVHEQMGVGHPVHYYVSTSSLSPPSRMTKFNACDLRLRISRRNRSRARRERGRRWLTDWVNDGRFFPLLMGASHRFPSWKRLQGREVWERMCKHSFLEIKMYNFFVFRTTSRYVT